MQPANVGSYEPIPEKLRARFFPKCPPGTVVRLGVHGEGSCFFHSLAAAINYGGYRSKPLDERGELGRAFRCKFQNHMDRDLFHKIRDESPENMRLPFDAVHDNYCVPTEWAEETMIKYTSVHLHLNIIFIDTSTSSGKFYCPVHGNPVDQNTVVILWVDHSHFEPVLFNANDTTGATRRRGMLLATNPRDAKAVIQPLMSTFGNMCHSEGAR